LKESHLGQKNQFVGFMKQLRIKSILVLPLFFQLNLVEGQIQKGELILGKSIASEIAPNEQHRYQVNL
jgi:hypothetical protein